MRILVLVLSAALGSAIPAVASAGNNVPSTSRPSQEVDKRYGKPKPVDCHRDVRTHRIGGVKVTHRHVGQNCEVRVVRKVN